MQRYFLVGCPRSGTTLLQAMLARHRSVYTIPESHFFQKIRGRLGEDSPWPIVSPRAASRALEALVVACGSPAGIPPVPRWWPGRGRYASTFAQVLDQAAQLSGATIWLEKSPVHLHYIDEIRRHIPDASFVHLLRDGRDVVASLVQASEREPTLWVPQLLERGTKPERRRLIYAAAARWNSDVERSLALQTEAGHLLVFYEDLVVDTRRTLKEISGFMAVPYDESMERHWETADRVVGPRVGLPHMEKALQPLEDRRLRRFEAEFDAAERQLVVSSLRFDGDPQAGLTSPPGSTTL